MSPGNWMRANLTTQGYCLSDEESRELWLGLRFSTGLCLSLVVVALVLESPLMVFALSAIGLVAGFGGRHPFDYIWNHGARHLTGAPAAPQGCVMTTQAPVDVEVLRHEIRRTYTDVSKDQEQEFIFPTGRWWAK